MSNILPILALVTALGYGLMTMTRGSSSPSTNTQNAGARRKTRKNRRK
jgi:hypothetical protein